MIEAEPLDVIDVEVKYQGQLIVADLGVIQAGLPRTLHVEAEPGFPGWEAHVVHASWADAMPAGSDEGGAFEFFVDNYEPVISVLGRIIDEYRAAP